MVGSLRCRRGTHGSVSAPGRCRAAPPGSRRDRPATRIAVATLGSRRADLATSTVCAVLKRLNLNRLSKLEPLEPPNRYCRRHPGELIHVDVKKLGRFRRPGHRVTGRGPGSYNYKPGWEAVHVCVDDTSRLAYVEILPDEKGPTSVGFLQRAIAWFAQRGISIERVMTDNGAPYVSAPGRPGARTTTSATSAPVPIGPAPTAKLNDSSKPCCASGLTLRSTKTTNTEPPRWFPGSTTTTTNGPTAPSVTSHPSAGSRRLTNAHGIYS